MIFAVDAEYVVQFSGSSFAWAVTQEALIAFVKEVLRPLQLTS